jgi:hypothetical protein
MATKKVITQYLLLKRKNNVFYWRYSSR